MVAGAPVLRQPSVLRAAQDSCGQVVNEGGSLGGAVQQPGSHILETLSQGDAGCFASLLELPPEAPTNLNKQVSAMRCRTS